MSLSNIENEEIYYTVKDIERILNMKQTTVYRLINDKSFPKIRMGKKKILIPKSDFEKFMQKAKSNREYNF